MKKEYQLLNNNNNNNNNKNPSNNQICKLEKNKTKKINVNASYLIFMPKRRFFNTGKMKTLPVCFRHCGCFLRETISKC